MTFGEIKEVVNDFLSKNKDVDIEDIAHFFIDKQKELQLPDLDLGIILATIGAKDFLTEGAIKALEAKGFLKNGGDEESEPKEEEKSSNEEEEKSSENDDESEKDEVRKLYSGE